MVFLNACDKTTRHKLFLLIELLEQCTPNLGYTWMLALYVKCIYLLANSNSIISTVLLMLLTRTGQ